MEFIKKIVKGMVIGVANAVPGVSGGTMMVSMGVYDDIIYCITHLFKQLKKSVAILLPYLIGMIIGIVGLAFSIKFFLKNYPFQTGMIFIGLIIGGIPFLWKKAMYDGEKKEKINIVHLLIFVIFFGLIILMQVVGGQNSGDVKLTMGVIPVILLFLVGIIASATMVIPGVSGSMMLMILGYYNPIITAITTFVECATKGDVKGMLNVSAFLVPFGLGVVFGIFAIAKLIEFLFKRFKTHTYSAIFGLVIASPVVILMGTSLVNLNIVSIITGIIAFVVGGVIALKLGD